MELFDREFVESQEAAGIRLLGQFRDLDRPDRFVWLRGFDDMAQRRIALSAFYGGPVWRAHRQAANATMVDSDDVLLLRPMRATADVADARDRADFDAARFVVTICSLEAPVDRRRLTYEVLPAVASMSPAVCAAFVEEPGENTFPKLPVREDEHVAVWIQRAADRAAETAALDASHTVPEALLPGLVGTAMVLRLEPTTRSRLR